MFYLSDIFLFILSEIFNRSNAETILYKTIFRHKDAKNFENCRNPVILVFIGQLSLSTLR